MLLRCYSKKKRKKRKLPQTTWSVPGWPNSSALFHFQIGPRFLSYPGGALTGQLGGLVGYPGLRLSWGFVCLLFCLVWFCFVLDGVSLLFAKAGVQWCDRLTATSTSQRQVILLP